MMEPARHETDETLADQASHGSREAFSLLYERYYPVIFDLAARIARDPDTAGDITQNAFVKAWDTLRRGRGPRQVRPWLYTIARNTALDELRRQRRLVLVDTEAEPTAERATVFTDLSADPATTVEDQELAQLVWASATSLSPSEYSLLDLHVRRGLSADELAAELGRRKGNIYTMLSRLRDSLAETAVTLTLLCGAAATMRPTWTHSSAPPVSVLTPSCVECCAGTPDCTACSDRERFLAAPAQIFTLLPLVRRRRCPGGRLAGHLRPSKPRRPAPSASARWSRPPNRWNEATMPVRVVAAGTTAVIGTATITTVLVLATGGAGEPPAFTPTASPLTPTAAAVLVAANPPTIPPTATPAPTATLTSTTTPTPTATRTHGDPDADARADRRAGADRASSRPRRRWRALPAPTAIPGSGPDRDLGADRNPGPNRDTGPNRDPSPNRDPGPNRDPSADRDARAWAPAPTTPIGHAPAADRDTGTHRHAGAGRVP
jgi:RNA polymerase sigma-70 factor (ECF subfamily)